jgi:tetratricopeptide (TPR) repeat protein
VAVVTALVATGPVRADDYLNQMSKQFDAHFDAKRYKDAEFVARQALQYATPRGDLGVTTAWLGAYGNALRFQEKTAEAEAALKTYLELSERQFGLATEHVARAHLGLGYLESDRARFDAAEPHFKQAVAIRERISGPESKDTANVLYGLADLYVNQGGRSAEAVPLLERVIAIREKVLGPEHALTAQALTRQGVALKTLGRYDESEARVRRALAIQEKTVGPDDDVVGDSLGLLGRIALRRGRYAEAEARLKKALAVHEKARGPESRGAADALADLAELYYPQGRYAEAEAVYDRAVTVAEKAYGPDSGGLAQALYNLANCRMVREKYADAEPVLRRALAIREKVLGADHISTAVTLKDLASLCGSQARYAEAEALAKRALALHEKAVGADHALVADDLQTLGRIYLAQGRYKEAEQPFQRALEVRRKAFGPDDVSVARTLADVGRLANNQRRYDEARALYHRALAMIEKALGPDHPDAVACRNALNAIDLNEGKAGDALPRLQATLADLEKQFGPESPSAANSHIMIGAYHEQQRDWNEAVRSYQRALAIYTKAYGRDQQEVATILLKLATCYSYQDKLAEGEPLVDRAIEIYDRTSADPKSRSDAYSLRACYAWVGKRRSEALADLGKALDFAEQARGQATGTGLDRAAYFGTLSSVFERMVEWQTEINDAPAVFAAMERTRARSLLEEFAVVGADLDAGRSPEEREALARRQAERKAAVADLEKKLARLGPGSSPDEVRRLTDELAAARDKLYEQYREGRTSSPVYQNLISSGGTLPRLSQVQRRLLPDAGLMLMYMVGDNETYLLVAGDKGATVSRLKVAPDVAKALGIEPGPLTAAKLQSALIDDKHTGAVQLLADPSQVKAATPKLAALWDLLAPISHQLGSEPFGRAIRTLHSAR